MSDNTSSPNMSSQHPDPSDQRLETREEVTLFVEYDGADDILGDYTENLSNGGTFVATTRELEIGTEVKLVLQFPGLLRPMAIAGVVRWKRDGEAGCGIEFIDSPARDALADMMERIRRRDPATMQPAYRVLIVEDNIHIASLIQEGLVSSKGFGERAVFQFRQAHNGKLACELLAEHTFDAMIIDIYLPMMDGSDVIAHARQKLQLTTLPIIAVSGGGPAAKKLAVDAGADMFIDKPMRLKQVVETMQRLLISGAAKVK
jgi:uncharacterized protein (TIGR02266 family)